MAQVEVIPCVKISGQGITLYNEVHMYSEKTGNEIPKRYNHDRLVSSSDQMFCLYEKLKPSKICPLFSYVGSSLSGVSKILTCSECEHYNKPLKKEITKNTPEILDNRSVSGIKNAIYAMLWLSGSKYKSGTKIVTYPKKKLTFATLTLPSEQRHPDTFLKSECLNQFFTEFRKKKPDLLYVWRSEKQKNGNCHFHILLNHFYDYLTLNSQWNRITDKYDYVKEYTRKFSKMTLHDYISNYTYQSGVEYQKLVDRYRKGIETEWKKPNSTDIDFLHAVENVPGYISKEMTKQNNVGGPAAGPNKWKFQSTGKAWSCSQEITAKAAYSGHVPDMIYDELNNLKRIIPNKEFKNDYITHYSLSPDLFLEYKLNNLFTFWMRHITGELSKQSGAATHTQIEHRR